MNPRNYNVKIDGTVHLPRWGRDLRLISTKCGIVSADYTKTIQTFKVCPECDRRAIR